MVEHRIVPNLPLHHTGIPAVMDTTTVDFVFDTLLVALL